MTIINKFNSLALNSSKPSLKQKIVNWLLKDAFTSNIVKYKSEFGFILRKAKINDACFDICSAYDYVIPTQDRCLISTGIYLELPPKFEAQIRSRSGLALKNGIMVLNSPGTIDEDYRGELKIILFNTSKEDFPIKAGERIAQIKFSYVFNIELQYASTINTSTERGNTGFGSSGK